MTISEELDSLSLNTRFTLEQEISPLQKAFLDRHGYLIFSGFATQEEVQSINSEIDRITNEFVEENRTEVRGIPLFRGHHYNGGTSIQRLPFTSLFSTIIHQFLDIPRFEPIRKLIGQDTRIGHNEKDGCVVNTYFNTPKSAYPKLGWHTDGIRDLFYLRMPKQMLNVGIHLSDCPKTNGGLRLLSGTHNQGFFSMCFRKLYFIYHRADKKEIAVETKAGDLTVHDGRLWHRVQQSPNMGPESFRRTMYIPFLTDIYTPKEETSKTPFYHKLGMMLRKLKGLP
jgi:phytanoyl-CoA hydroxylase